MISLNWLPETAYQFALIFARAGTMLMLMPALGEQAVPQRLRLGFALVLSFVLYPIVSANLPAFGDDLVVVGGHLLHEIAVGLILGGVLRFVTTAAAVAGAIIAYQTGLSTAITSDPVVGAQGALIGAFLSLLGVALIFATDLHHVALMAISDSYLIFPPTAPLFFGDALQTAIRAVSAAFVIGVQMSAPFIVLGLVFYLGMGVLGRLMPQLQIFFLAAPVSIWGGLTLFALLLTMIMGWYITHFEAELAIIRGL